MKRIPALLLTALLLPSRALAVTDEANVPPQVRAHFEQDPYYSN